MIVGTRNVEGGEKHVLHHPPHVLRIASRSLAVGLHAALASARILREKKLAQLCKPLERLTAAPCRSATICPLVVTRRIKERMMRQSKPFATLFEQFVAACGERILEVSDVDSECETL